MALEPRAFLSFSAEHYLLLLDIYKCDRDISESEIYEFIIKNRKPDSPQAEYIFNQLKTLKIIQPPPDATAFYEIAHVVKNLISFLEHEHRFTSVAEIQSYLDEIESLHLQLGTAFKEKKKGLIFNLLRDMSELVERLRQSSNGNRLAIIRAVREVKLNTGNESTTDRYDRISDLVSRYINPLKDLIQVDKSMDMLLYRCETLLKHAEEEYVFEKDVLFKIKRVSSRLPRLRRELFMAFQESFDEIVPLLDKLQANLFGRGVTVVLSNVSKKGNKALDDIVDELSLPSSKQRHGLFDDARVLDFFQEVGGYKPKLPPQIKHDEVIVDRQFLFNASKILNAAKVDLPIADAFVWVASRYAEHNLLVILKAYNFLINHASDFQYSPERKKHTLKGFNVHIHPLLIRKI